MNIYRVASVLALALLALPSATAAACDSTPFRQFDFWLGEWQVRTPDGKLAGTNRIERQYDGCVIHEHYTTGRGYSGESLNIYDEPRKVWHQTWFDNSGTLLSIEGQWIDGKMVLQGQSTGSDGLITRHRISWTPNADGSVRQLWESTDAKGAWSGAFDGVYARK